MGRKAIYSSNALTGALSQINREVSNAQKKGLKGYFNKADVYLVYHRHKGKCAFCGGQLADRGRSASSARFMLYVPIRNGGKAEVENLVLTCAACKRDYTSYPRSKGRVEGYNSLADIIPFSSACSFNTIPSPSLLSLKQPLPIMLYILTLDG